MKLIDRIQRDIRKKEKRKEPYRIGVALGGGLLNGSFGGGVVEAVDDLHLSPYVTVIIGSSAGAIPAAFYATGADICSLKESYYEDAKKSWRLKRSDIFYPDYAALRTVSHLFHQFSGTPKRFFKLYSTFTKPGSLISSVFRLPRATMKGAKSLRQVRGYNLVFNFLLKGLPIPGFLSMDRIEKYLDRNLAIKDFRILERKIRASWRNGTTLYKKLYITGSLLDYHGRRVVFGKENKEVPIPVAAAASMSFPLLFSPRYIKEMDRYVIDGEISHALSMDKILEDPIDLAIGTNIYLPYRYSADRGSLSTHGLGYITQQTLLIMISQKIKRSLQYYASTYPDRNLVMIQPSDDDSSIFFNGYFDFSSMIKAWDAGYVKTMEVFQDEVMPVRQRGPFRTLLNDVRDLRDIH
jgi:predicted acylesterase/phospholipase RssA